MQKNKLFTALYTNPFHYGVTFLGVFSTEEKAQKAIKAHIRAMHKREKLWTKIKIAAKRLETIESFSLRHKFESDVLEPLRIEYNTFCGSWSKTGTDPDCFSVHETSLDKIIGVKKKF